MVVLLWWRVSASLRVRKEWLTWIQSTAGPKISFVMRLTSAFGLRCGEALALKREDINLEATIPTLIITGLRILQGCVYTEATHQRYEEVASRRHNKHPAEATSTWTRHEEDDFRKETGSSYDEIAPKM